MSKPSKKTLEIMRWMAGASKEFATMLKTVEKVPCSCDPSDSQLCGSKTNARRRERPSLSLDRLFDRLPQYLTEYMRDTGMGTKDIARRIGCHQTYLALVLKGKRKLGHRASPRIPRPLQSAPVEPGYLKANRDAQIRLLRLHAKRRDGRRWIAKKRAQKRLARTRGVLRRVPLSALGANGAHLKAIFGSPRDAAQTAKTDPSTE